MYMQHAHQRDFMAHDIYESLATIYRPGQATGNT